MIDGIKKPDCLQELFAVFGQGIELVRYTVQGVRFLLGEEGAQDLNPFCQLFSCFQIDRISGYGFVQPLQDGIFE